MTKCKKPTPYDSKLIAAQCNPVTLRLGCAAGCWKGEDFDMCGKPPVAIRRWTRDDGYDDCVFLVKSVFRVSSLIFFGFRHEECRPVVCFTGCPSCRT